MARSRVTIKFHDKRFTREMTGIMLRRLSQAGEYLRSQIVRNISVPTRRVGPSAPGEYPHADTGTLRKSIFSRREGKNKVIIGSTLEYAVYLELGTSRMAPRPYFSRTTEENRKQIERIMFKPTKLRSKVRRRRRRHR